MKIKMRLPARLALAILFFALGRELRAQSGNSNVGNTAGLYQTILSQAVLTATTSTGQDVSAGLTVPVGQPMPTVTFSISGPGVLPAGSWLVLLVGESGVSGEDYYGMAPGLSILGGTFLYNSGPVGSGPPIESVLSGATVAQLGGTPTQIGTWDITLVAYQTQGSGGGPDGFF